MLISNLDQTRFNSILSRMSLYRLKYRELLYACCNFAFSDYHSFFERSQKFSSVSILFQHESLSVKMFKHLVEKNNLDAEFKKYLKKPNLTKNKTFIMELIEGPSEDEAQVNKNNFFSSNIYVFKSCARINIWWGIQGLYTIIKLGKTIR